jgi:hypothetical protein
MLYIYCIDIDSYGTVYRINTLQRCTLTRHREGQEYGTTGKAGILYYNDNTVILAATSMSKTKNKTRYGQFFGGGGGGGASAVVSCASR